MALAPRQSDYNIPTISQQPITSDGRGPSATFVRFWQQLRQAIIAALSGIQDQVTDLAAIQLALSQQQTQLLVQQQQIINALNAAGIATTIAQSAQTTANNAQASADAGGSATARSGSNTDPAIDLGPLNTWIQGPIVNLLTVSAGDLTIPGTGPQQDSDVYLQEGSTFSGQFRVAEVIGGIDTALFGPWDFTATASGPPDGFGNYPALVSNDSTAAVAAFLFARSSTGSVDYRIDARWTGGLAPLKSLQLYIFARRS